MRETDLEKEKLSALVDGEVSPTELGKILDATCKSLEIRKVLGRYNRISSSLKGEGGSDLADKIWSQLEQEPSIVAPNNIGSISNVIKHRFNGKVRRFAAGMAIAATVASIAVGGLRFLAPSVATSPQLLATGPEQADYVRASGMRWQLDDPVLENDLNVYLVEHGGFAGSANMNGIQSYVKVAGYDDEQ